MLPAEGFAQDSCQFMKSGFANQKANKQEASGPPAINDPALDKTRIRKPRTSRWRAITLITLNLLMIAHIIQWRFMGQTISPIEPAEAMYTLQRGAINAGFIFFSLAILTTLVFGRFFCGWGCHMVALQDLCGWLLKKFGLRPKPFRSRLLVFVPLFAALYMFVWPTAIRLFAKPKNEPLIPQFTNHLVTTDFWATFPPVAVAIPFLFICGFMTVYFLGAKGFCTYACPYGGFYSLIDKLSLGKIRVTDACDQCGHCTAVCTSNVRVHTEVKQFGMVVDPSCHRAMDCISVCPQDALYFGFGKPSITVPKSKAGRRSYSLTWPEELFGAAVFLVSYFAVWDAYQLVPMLMALGIALITTYLALRTLRLFQVRDLSFYRFRLKSSGKIRKAGWAFFGFAVLWIGLNIHSGWVRYNERAGTIAFESLQIPDELALAQSNPRQWLNSADQKNVANGKDHFNTAANVGLFVNNKALPKQAWLEYLSGNTERAVQLLDTASDRSQGQSKALSLYYRGAILNRLGRYNDALANLDQALAESPDLILAHEEKGESLWQLGRLQEAVQEWSDTVHEKQGLVLTNAMLAGAAALLGDSKKSIAYEDQADKFTPNDPYFHWMVGLRLQNVGMNGLAENHFQLAMQLDPKFRARRNSNSESRH